jgi:hypothetical protein
MLRRVAPVRTNVSEEYIASIIRVTRISELGTMLAVTSSRSTLRRNTMSMSSLHIDDNYVIFEVFTEVTMKNVVFWDIKTQFVPHRKNVTTPLQIPPC